MKKEINTVGVLSAALFVAMLLYIGINLINRMMDPVQTALVVNATMTDSSALSGLVLRDETVLESSGYVDVTAEDGEKVAAGATVAESYADADTLDRANQMAVLEQEISDVEEALSNTSDTTSGNRDSSISAAIYELSADIRSGSYSAATTQADSLQSLLFRTDTSDANEAYLDELKQEYSEIAAGAAAQTTDITVDEAGTFTSLIDGFETVTPELVEGLTPNELREIISGERDFPENAIGKVVTSYYWYYAAILTQEDASRLIDGMTVKLSFGRYYEDNVTATVESVGYAENHEQVVLFRMDKGFEEMLTVRAVTAELIYSEYTGLRIPVKSLYHYYAAYVNEEDADQLTEGGSVTLTVGGQSYDGYVSEIGSAFAKDDLPKNVEEGSEQDTRERVCIVVFYWPWSADEEAPDYSANDGTATVDGGKTIISLDNYYEYDPEADNDRLCVFTMTGMQAERKKVDLVFAGDEYCLVSSEGEDALREGNEIIVTSRTLFSGRVY